MSDTLAPWIQLVGTAMKGASEYAYRATQGEMQMADAAAERDAAQQQAERILRATQRTRGAARAATAASGARIDANSLMNEQEIIAAGETDAAMAILTGRRRSRTLETGARLNRAAGYSAVGSSLFNMGSQIGNWKGAKGVPQQEMDSQLYDERGSL